MTRPNKDLNILLLEDESRRATLVRELLKESHVACRLHTMGVGHNALKYLQHIEPFDDAPTPDLILFDVADPDKQSLKILDTINTKDSSRNIPCVLITSPDSEHMLQSVYGGNRLIFSPIELHAFLEKMQSIEIDRFLQAVKLIDNHGFVLVRLPTAFIQ